MCVCVSCLLSRVQTPAHTGVHWRRPGRGLEGEGKRTGGLRIGAVAAESRPLVAVGGRDDDDEGDCACSLLPIDEQGSGSGGSGAGSRPRAGWASTCGGGGGGGGGAADRTLGGEAFGVREQEEECEIEAASFDGSWEGTRVSG
jgi:hypothetical protein